MALSRYCSTTTSIRQLFPTTPTTFPLNNNNSFLQQQHPASTTRQFETSAQRAGTAAHPIQSLKRLKKERGANDGAFVFTEPDCRQFLSYLNATERQHFRRVLDEKIVVAEIDPIADAAVPKPTTAQLKSVALYQALPFVGFGFLDNLIMIVAGDYIDVHIGATLAISTMAAAALGNLVSDLAGIGCSGYVETLASRFQSNSSRRNQVPRLRAAQMTMKRTIWASNFGRAIGIAVGCLLGMFPLLFLPNRKPEATKKLE